MPGNGATVRLPAIQWSVLSCFHFTGYFCGINTEGAIECTDNTDLIPLGHSYVSISTTFELSAAVTDKGEAVLWGAIDLLYVCTSSHNDDACLVCYKYCEIDAHGPMVSDTRPIVGAYY